MSESIDFGNLDRSARRAGYRDGLLEVFAAIVLSVIALAWLASPPFVGIVSAFIVLYGWKAVEKVKERVTYPRIGYFQERADEPKSTAWGMLVFIVGAFALMIVVVALSGGLSDSAEWRRAAPLVSGLTLAAGFWYAGDHSGLLRHRLISMYSVAGGIALWALGDGASYSGVVWHLTSLAVPLAAIGVWAMLRFIASHPVQAIDG